MKDMYNIAMDIHEVLEKETQNINMLSGGEKQKVELVKTILKDADVYFLMNQQHIWIKSLEMNIISI